MDEDLELLSLSGSLAAAGPYLRLSVSQRDGCVPCGHAACGGHVRTMAEVLLALLSRWWFSREHDARTGYDDRVARSHTD